MFTDNLSLLHLKENRFNYFCVNDKIGINIRLLD